MQKKFILSIDQSTSGTKAVLFTKDCKVHNRVTINHAQIHPCPGWVEHNPDEIIKNVKQAIIQVINESSASWDDVAAIAISNQRETGMVWDSVTGKPIYNAIVWQCPRAKDICEKIKEKDLIYRKTGLNLSPYFTAPKIRWILENVPEAGKMAESGRLKFGTMDSWVLYNLTGGKVHATDYSNASRTLLLNLNTLEWDKELLDIFAIPLHMMPEIKPSDTIFGVTEGDDQIPDGIPISGVMGDSHAALFGQNCYLPGMIKTTYGTGSSVMMNIGEKPVFSGSGIVTSVGWVSTGETVYVLEGNINSTGKTIEWIAENAELLSSPKESGIIASKLPDNGGVYFVPAFTGLGAPYWNNDARAIITGLTLSSGKEHIIRAAEESIAYQINDVITLMRECSGSSIADIRVDGGPTRDAFLMQFQADISNAKVIVPAVEELSALGSANMAGLATGFWKNRDEITKNRTVLKEYVPGMDLSKRQQYIQGWQEAVNRAVL